MFAAILGVAALHFQEPMKWIGEVKAFDFYISRDCLPQDRLLTIYAARKLFEDGSTVTIVQSIPSGLPVSRRPIYFGGGRIERDATNAVTRMTSGGRFVNLPGLRSPNDLESWESEMTADASRRILLGQCTTSDSRSTSCKLSYPNSGEYLLDPIEALAFSDGNLSALSRLIPAPFSSVTDPKGKSVAVRMIFGPAVRRAYSFRGKSRSFQQIDFKGALVGSSRSYRSVPMGSLFFNENGTLAAYHPVMGSWWRLPSMNYSYGPFGSSRTWPTEPPPVALTGKSKEMWEEAASSASPLPDHIILPGPVSAAKRAEILAMIEDRMKPDAPGTKPVGSDSQ